MVKKKKIGSTWSRRDRLINGKPRRIWVRKKGDKYETRAHKPEVHGIALAKKINAQRPKKSQKRDKQRSNKNIITPTDKNLKKWKKRPGSADIKGDVDTKKHTQSVKKKSSTKKRTPLSEKWEYRYYSVDGKRTKHVARKNKRTGKIEKIQIE